MGVLVAQRSPSPPILPDTNEALWGSILGLVVVAAVVLVAIWFLLRYIRETRAMAEKALRQSQETPLDAGAAEAEQRRP